jgi:poly(hydroxyalkanoate) depolymerase family esterase
VLRRLIVSIALTAALGATAAHAASLVQVSNWGVTGLPSDVSMYIYVPDRVATNPPILTLIHYCGGTASGVFGQAQGGGIVKAADQYGFVIVAPSSGRCWDTQSSKTWTRDGGGDSHAIRQMVRYAVSQYKANADRVYATGDSSGAMMTELLLALYPDVFKAGSAFAGMPAACRNTNESGVGGGYSGACAGGLVTHTAQQWGDIARMLDPGYTGHRARVQMFHGDADPTIKYVNFTEAIKEWTNVLGLAATPTTTTMNVPLGMHQATRQQWLNACGYLVLDGFTSIGGDHGPSDALFKADYVIPFLGLDKTGAVDPEIQQCGSGGTGGTSGADAGVDGGAGGASGGGGRGGSGGAGTSGSAGTGGRGGASAGGTTGGTTTGSGGASGRGGTVGTGGSGGDAGTSGQGGQGGGGATGGSGGDASGRGGSGNDGERGGSTGAGTGGTSNASGAAGNTGGGESGGCSCSVATDSNAHKAVSLFALGALTLVTCARRRRHRPRGPNR